MISPYDELKERVKLKTAKFDGKAHHQTDRHPVDIKTIIQQNKSIMESKKLLQLKVIQARKLKIKVEQVLNFGKKQVKAQYQHVSRNSSHSKISKKQKDSSSSNLMKPPFKHPISKQHIIINKSSNRIKQSPIQILSWETHANLQGESTNIFQKFNDEQLSLIEEDVKYYLIKEQFIQLFRKFMIKKRLNKKDKSYEKFMLKFNAKEKKNNENNSIQNINNLKQIMLTTLGYSNSADKIDNKIHSLTNRINYKTEKMSPYACPKSLIQFKKNVQAQLQAKQVINRQRLNRIYDNKKLHFRISLNYVSGVVAQKKAMILDEKIKEITERNKVNETKSTHCRERIKTLKEEYGESIVIAESIRTEIIRNRSTRQSIRL